MTFSHLTRRAAAACIACGMLLVLVHCGEKSSEEKTASKSSTELYASTAQTLDPGSSGEVVSFETPDGVRIEGDYYSSGKKNAPVVICLHQWLSDRSVFRQLAMQLTASGFHVLAIDMRGHGGSTRSVSGGKIAPDRHAGPDIEAAISFVQNRSDVIPGRIAIIGASYGASNALIYAAGRADIRVLVLLSPGLNYFNVLPTEEAMRKYGGRPVLSVASEEDMRSVEAVERYRSIGGAENEILMLRDAGHGTNMLSASPDLSRAIIEFCNKHL